MAGLFFQFFNIFKVIPYWFFRFYQSKSNILRYFKSVKIYQNAIDLFISENICKGSFVKKNSHNCMLFRSIYLHICISIFFYFQICTSLCLLIFTSIYQYLDIFIFAHLYFHIFISISLLIFPSAYLHLCSYSHLQIFTSTDLLALLLILS